MPSVARSVQNVPHSRIRELAEIAMSMDGVLRLYFGESNLPTPGYIKQAAVRAIEEGHTFYTENAGLPSLPETAAILRLPSAPSSFAGLFEDCRTRSRRQAESQTIEMFEQGLDPGNPVFHLRAQ